MNAPYFTEVGEADAPLLVCLHGIGSNADAFEPQHELAARLGRRLVAWDAPGYRRSEDFPVSSGGDSSGGSHGDSSAESGVEPGLDDWADAAAELIRTCADGTEHPTANNTPTGTPAGTALLGVSWGGVIATRLCLRHPELVSALILADSSCGAGGREETAQTMRSRAAALGELGAQEFARSRAQLLVSESAPEALRTQVAKMMVESLRMPSYQWACNSMADTYHAPQLAQIDIPTLVIVGEKDQVTPPAASKKLADGIAGAHLVSIAAAGHLANQEQPAAFNQAVVQFLAAPDS